MHEYDPIGKTHDSVNFQQKGREGSAEGHDKTATRANRKGGSEQLKPL